jgi:transposase
LVAQGCEPRLVAETVGVSRSSLYYRARGRASRADRSLDEVIVEVCGEKPVYGYRRVAWWLGRKRGLVVNGKRVLRVMRERGLLFSRGVCGRDARRSGAVSWLTNRINSGRRI